MSKPFYTLDVIQLRVKHAKAGKKVSQQCACFHVENSILYANVTRKHYYAVINCILEIK